MLRPDAAGVLKRKLHSGVWSACSGKGGLCAQVCSAGAREGQNKTKKCWIGRATQQPEKKGRWPLKQPIQGKWERGCCEHRWWPPRTRLRLLSSCSSPGLRGSRPHIPFLLHTPSPLPQQTFNHGTNHGLWFLWPQQVEKVKDFSLTRCLPHGLSRCLGHLSWIWEIQKYPSTWDLASSMLLAQYYYSWEMSWVKQTNVDQSGDLAIKFITVSTEKLLEFQTKWQREFWTNTLKIRDCMPIEER